MKAHAFAQSNLEGLSGQQGMPSDMSMSAAADMATSVETGFAIVAVDIGPSTSPNRASAASRRRMVNNRFTPERISHRDQDGKGGAFTFAIEPSAPLTTSKELQ